LPSSPHWVPITTTFLIFGGSFWCKLRAEARSDVRKPQAYGQAVDKFWDLHT
jgi:hypothetical protein